MKLLKFIRYQIAWWRWLCRHPPKVPIMNSSKDQAEANNSLRVKHVNYFITNPEPKRGDFGL
jgi:hypothetical protein